MRRWRALWRIARSTGHALAGAAICGAVFPFIDARARRRHVQAWSLRMLAAMGIGLAIEGEAIGAPRLLLANHVSWLDILAIDAVQPVRFVSKADIRRWPVLGFMVAAGGTLFIERERKRDALRVVHQVAEALHAGETVAVFPEGTTGCGPLLLPFHANLLQAAITTATPVQPVALRYADAAAIFSPAVEFIGATSLVESVWRVACADALVIHVAVLPALPSAGTDRRRLAETAQRRIQEALDQRAACAATAAAARAAASASPR